MRFLRQSTAVDLALGPFLDATDGITPETALSIVQASVRLKKNNGAWAQINDATTATHEENGWYEKEFDATDCNTLGILLVSVQMSGAVPVWHEFMVIPAIVYDSFILGTEFMPIDPHKQKFAVAAGNLTTKKPDGTTSTDYSPKPVTSDAAALPIIGA
jgi:hypothetical protein